MFRSGRSRSGDEGRIPAVARVVLAATLCLNAGVKIEALADGVQPTWSLVLPSEYWLWAAAALEIALAAGLISSAWRRAAFGTAALIAAFAVALGVLAARGEGVAACGCFGRTTVSTGGHAAHLAGMFILTALVMVRPAAGSPGLCLDRTSGPAESRKLRRSGRARELP